MNAWWAGVRNARGTGFTVLHLLTPGLAAPKRLVLFDRLPGPLQRACWQGLRRSMDRQR